jgi:hypothetical protein
VTGVQEFGRAVLAVTYRGTQGQLAAALNARGWTTDVAEGGVFRITGYRAAPAPAPTPAPQPAPAQPQPAPQPPQPQPQPHGQSD